MNPEIHWRIFTDIEAARKTILKRHSLRDYEAPDHVTERSIGLFGERLMPDEVVRRIIKSVREGGDQALLDWNRKIDRISQDSLVVSRSEMQAALTEIPSDLRTALEYAADRVRRFHQKQPIASWIDAQRQGTLGQLIRPVDSVGVYVPGGDGPFALFPAYERDSSASRRRAGDRCLHAAGQRWRRHSSRDSGGGGSHRRREDVSGSAAPKPSRLWHTAPKAFPAWRPLSAPATCL